MERQPNGEESQENEEYYTKLEQTEDNIPADFLTSDGLVKIAEAWRQESQAPDRQKYQDASGEYYHLLEEANGYGDEIPEELFERLEAAGEQMVQGSKLLDRGPIWDCPKFTDSQREVVKLAAKLRGLKELVENHKQGKKLNSDDVIKRVQDEEIPGLENQLKESQDLLTELGIKKDLLMDKLYHWASELNDARKILERSNLPPQSREEWLNYQSHCAKQVDGIEEKLRLLDQGNS